MTDTPSNGTSTDPLASFELWSKTVEDRLTALEAASTVAPAVDPSVLAPVVAPDAPTPMDSRDTPGMAPEAPSETVEALPE